MYRAKDINDEMKIAAAEALAGLITDEELTPDYIIPKAFDKRVGAAVAKAVAETAKKDWRSPYLKINSKKNPSSLTGSFFLLSLKKCSIVILYVQKMSV